MTAKSLVIAIPLCKIKTIAKWLAIIASYGIEQIPLMGYAK